MKFVDAVRAQMKLAVNSRAAWFGIAICVLPWAFNVGINELALRVTGSVEIGPELLFTAAGGMVCMALGVVWGILAWREEPPRMRFYHWSLPMDTSVHDLARVAAFLLWFLLALTLYMIVGIIVMAVYDVPLRFSAVGIVPWLGTCLAGVIGFLLGAAYSTAFERPFEYVIGTLILIWGLVVIAALYRFDALKSLISSLLGPGSEYGLLAAISNAGIQGGSRYVDPGASTQHLPVAGPLALWLAIAATALVAASLYNRGRVR